MPGAFIQNDLDLLFGSSDFGEPGNYKGRTVMGIFDDADVEVTLGEGVNEIHHVCRFATKSSEFVGVKDGDVIIIRNRSLVIKNWKDDGVGVIELMLANQ